MSTWSGELVSEQLGLTLGDEPTNRIPLRELVGLALRMNSKRAHLLVSTVLGKYIPTNAQTVLAAGKLLGLLVAARIQQAPFTYEAWVDPSCRVELLDVLVAELKASFEDDAAGRHLNSRLDAMAVRLPHLVIGYAETATALGATVAQQLGTAYIHSTRYPTANVQPYGVFEEPHSHASTHHLVPSSEMLNHSVPVVLVDDELTTGSTIINTIRELHAQADHPAYYVATLVDLRGAEDRQRLDKLSAELNVPISVVALASGKLPLNEDLPALAARIIKDELSSQIHPSADADFVKDVHLAVELPRHHMRNGVASVTEYKLAAERIANQLGPHVTGERALVLGLEEDMYLPLLIASYLPNSNTRFLTTTRGPVHPHDSPKYAIRTRIKYKLPASSGDSPKRYAYNVGYHDTIVVPINSPVHYENLNVPGGLLDQLRQRTSHLILLHGVTMLPQPLRGPEFGSYPTADVAWLLKDLSDAKIEASLEEREEAIQSGGAHYSESLPIEYQPGAAYQELFDVALRDNAPLLAEAVVTVGELILRAKKRPVLVSLARAGVPVGMLLRRYFYDTYGLEVPHYAISIIRGRGIDTLALDYLAQHHDPADILFVDGWTGKGAIIKELKDAVELYASKTGIRFSDELAVLADPGRCVNLYGTRDDYLIPSACLNATVTGLISRTVLRTDLIGPHDYHGGKFYRELADADVSNVFVDSIAAHFTEAHAKRAELLQAYELGHEKPDFGGWAAVEKISVQYGINNINLVKPGVGETTRVLLRRVPWRILMRPDRFEELRHVRLLAEQRQVEIELVSDLPYSCVGLVHPKYTRGASGFDGKAV